MWSDVHTVRQFRKMFTHVAVSAYRGLLYEILNKVSGRLDMTIFGRGVVL